MPSTPQRILDASLHLFNRQGYAATSLTEIASAVGISQGNLTYHFPAKRDLVEGVRQRAREQIRARRETHRPGAVADDYVEHLLFAMELTWSYHFLLRDQAQFDDGSPSGPSPEMAVDLAELRELMDRVAAAGLLRRDLPVDLEMLTRSLWIVSRYWMDHLREMEEVHEITWADQERGIQHHLAVLVPCLTAAGRREFESALLRASEHPLSRAAS